MSDAYVRLSAFTRDDLQRALERAGARYGEKTGGCRDSTLDAVTVKVSEKFHVLAADVSRAASSDEPPGDRAVSVTAVVSAASEWILDKISILRPDGNDPENYDALQFADDLVGELASFGLEIRPTRLPALRAVPPTRVPGTPRVKRLRGVT